MIAGMRTLLLIVAGITAAAGLLLQTAGWAAQPARQPLDEESYGVGFYLGEDVRREVRNDGVGADLDLLVKGFRDGLEGREPLTPRKELDAILVAVHEEMEARMVQRLLAESPQFKKLHDDNLVLSRKFHEAFGKQPGVVTLPSGAQYKVLQAGTGPSPRLSDTVVLNERVTLLDDTVLTEGNGVEVEVAGVVKGGIELLQRMKVGARWQVVIPPKLAHGAAGRFPHVGPNETMVGIVELVGIKK